MQLESFEILKIRCVYELLETGKKKAFLNKYSVTSLHSATPSYPLPKPLSKTLNQKPSPRSNAFVFNRTQNLTYFSTNYILPSIEVLFP